MRRFQQELESAARDIAATGRVELLKLDPSNHILSPLWVQHGLTRALIDYVAAFQDAAAVSQRVAR